MLGDARGWMGDARNKRAVGGSQWKTRGRWMGEGAVERSRRTLNKRKANEKPREREREREKERKRERERERMNERKKERERKEQKKGQ